MEKKKFNCTLEEVLNRIEPFFISVVCTPVDQRIVSIVSLRKKWLNAIKGREEAECR